MTKPILALSAMIALSITVTGCGLDGLMGKKSDTQVYYEEREAAGLPPPVNPWVATVAEIVPETEPVSVEVAVVEEQVIEPTPAIPSPTLIIAQPCYDVFRVSRCLDGESVEW